VDDDDSKKGHLLFCLVEPTVNDALSCVKHAEIIFHGNHREREKHHEELHKENDKITDVPQPAPSFSFLYVFVPFSSAFR